MADPANSVVQNLGGGEGLVTALVGQNPDTSSDQTLDDGVKGPQSNASWERGNGLRRDIVVEDIENGSQHGYITEHIVQAGESLPLVAVSGDGVTDLLDGVVGDLELISIGVQHLALVLRLGRQRRKGSRGRRMARAVKRRHRDAGDGGIRARVAVQRHALGDSCGRHLCL